MPDRWADDLPRRRAVGIPAGLEFATKPQLAMRQLERLADADAALDLQGGMMALVAPAGRGGQGVPADHRRPADRGLPHGCGSRRAGLGVYRRATGTTTDIVVLTTQARCSRHGVVAERADQTSFSVSLARHRD